MSFQDRRRAAAWYRGRACGGAAVRGARVRRAVHSRDHQRPVPRSRLPRRRDDATDARQQPRDRVRAIAVRHRGDGVAFAGSVERTVRPRARHAGEGTHRARFGMPWESPGPKFREYVVALKELFAAFGEGRPPAHRGKFYNHTISNPFFTPGPIGQPAPKVFIAAINPYNAESVGVVADGILVHPLHTTKYIDEVLFPAVDKGLAKSGRTRDDITVVCPVFLAVGDTDEAGADGGRIREDAGRVLRVDAFVPADLRDPRLGRHAGSAAREDVEGRHGRNGRGDHRRDGRRSSRSREARRRRRWDPATLRGPSRTGSSSTTSFGTPLGRRRPTARAHHRAFFVALLLLRAPAAFCLTAEHDLGVVLPVVESRRRGDAHVLRAWTDRRAARAAVAGSGHGETSHLEGKVVGTQTLVVA